MLEVRKLTKRFGQHVALSNVSIEFESGKIHGILGPNGAGKTTLIRIINQLFSPDEGGVYWDGKLINRKFLLRIGYLPEERGMYGNMTVQDYLQFLGELRGMEYVEIANQLEHWLTKLADLSWKTKRIEELSKGMAQKIQFIATVFHNPDIVILDEPFSGFDPTNVQLMRKVLRELRDEGKTVLLCTHNMNSVEELCDNVILLYNSKKVLEGKVLGLKQATGEKLYAVQFKGNMIAFATALWTGYELVDSKNIGEGRFIARVKLCGDNTFKDLAKTMLSSLEIEGVWEELPSMEDVFIRATETKN
jgi:ABC-2 type transport system ATP-binding protein